MIRRGHRGYMSGDGYELGIPGRENGIWMVMLCSCHSGIKSVCCTRKVPDCRETQTPSIQSINGRWGQGSDGKWDQDRDGARTAMRKWDQGSWEMGPGQSWEVEQGQ